MSDSKNMRWHYWVVAAMAILVVGCLVYRSYPPAWGWGWNRAIRSELPAGSNRRQIEAWLNAQRLHHDYCEYPDPDKSLPPESRFIMDSIGDDTVAQRAGVDQSQMSGFVRAEITSPSFALDTYELHAFFFLDKQDRLIKHSIEVWAGPGPK